jgi:hypothetical protein
VRWAGEILIRSVVSEPRIDVLSEQIGLAVTGRILLLLLGLAHVFVAFCAIWPEALWPGRRGVVKITSEGLDVTVPYRAIEDYILKVVRHVDGVKHCRARILKGESGLKAHLSAEFDLSRGTVPDLSRGLEQVLQQEIRTFGVSAIESFTVDVRRLIPHESKRGGQRTVMAAERAEQPATTPEPPLDAAVAQAEPATAANDAATSWRTAGSETPESPAGAEERFHDWREEKELLYSESGAGGEETAEPGAGDEQDQKEPKTV